MRFFFLFLKKSHNDSTLHLNINSGFYATAALWMSSACFVLFFFKKIASFIFLRVTARLGCQHKDCDEIARNFNILLLIVSNIVVQVKVPDCEQIFQIKVLTETSLGYPSEVAPTRPA